MRKRYSLGIGCLRPWRSTEGSPPREPPNAGLASSQAGASMGVCWLKTQQFGRFALRFAASLVAFAVLTFAVLVPLAACSTRGVAAEAALPPAGGPVTVLVVSFGPPALPVYFQPPLPGPGYIWAPGYWAWDPYYGYFWVPGMWVLAPFPGALWTPGYWWWSDPDDGFTWIPGYWGPVVGFYGGIDYGYGYFGNGYQGGYWRGGNFYYNRSVTNITTTNITNVYNTTVVEDPQPRGVSFNGHGGTTARPTPAQLQAARQKRMSATPSQTQQVQVAQADPKQRASVNHGRPAIAATQVPGKFTGSGVVRASRAGAPYKAPPMPKAQPRVPARAPARAAALAPSSTRSEKGSQPPAHPRNKPSRTPPPTPRAVPPPNAHQPPPPSAQPERRNKPEPRARPERPNAPGPPPERGRAQPQERRHEPGPPGRQQEPERKPEKQPGPPPSGQPGPPGH